MASSDTISPDVDKGWAFVIMLCGALTMIMTRGLTYTSAIFYITFLDVFEESPVFTAWAVSANIFCSLVTCVFLNFLLLLLGPRITVIIGCTLSTVGLLTCSFAHNLTTILFMYGIVTGTGFACCFISTYTVMSTYFKKYRVVAFGIMSAGTGIGQLLYPPVLRALMDEYVWRGAFLILAGINLNMLVIAAAYMRPREPHGVKHINEKTGKEKVKDVFKQLMKNAKIFRKPCWPFYCGAIGIYNLGINAFQTHISNYGRVAGLSSTDQTFLPSIIGIGSLTGSMIIAIITQIPKVPVLLMFLSTFTFLGVMCIVITFVDNVIGLFVCSFGAGFSLATIALSYEVVIFIIGIVRFSSAYSYALLFSAAGSLAGGPLAALVYEYDNSYRWSYRVLGFTSFFGVLLAIPSWLTFTDGKLQQKRPREEREKKDKSSTDGDQMNYAMEFSDMSATQDLGSNVGENGASRPEMTSCDEAGMESVTTEENHEDSIDEEVTQL